jgi:hypothetical protein
MLPEPRMSSRTCLARRPDADRSDASTAVLGYRKPEIGCRIKGATAAASDAAQVTTPRAPPYWRENLLKPNMPRPNRAPPIRLIVAGSGTPVP